MDTKTEMISVFTFFFQLWLSVIIIIWLSFAINTYLKHYVVSSAIRKLRNKVKFYPVVLIICWLFPSIDCILGLSNTNKDFEVVTILHLISINCPGFLNFFLFGLTYTKNILYKRLQNCRKKESGRNECMALNNMYDNSD